MKVSLALGCSLMLLTFPLAAQLRRITLSPAPAPPVIPAAPAGAPLNGLTAAEQAAFNSGRGKFGENQTVASGLGPVFNERSCTDCHNAPVAGGGRRNVTRFGTRVNGVFDALTNLGGSLQQDHAIGRVPGSAHLFAPEVVPAGATVVAQRRTTPLFGLGLVDATPDATFVSLAAAEAARGDGTAGRAGLVDNIRAGMKTVGKFGWKAQVPTLVQFSGDAFVNEMGITSPDFPNENCPQGNCADLAFNPAPGLNDNGTGVQRLTDFMRFLAPPPRGTQTAATTAGEAVFNAAGCNSCHVATLQSGASTTAALDHQTYHPYSDFLLHDIGSLGDGIDMGAGTGTEMRTAPLWGLRLINRYLHDGRAATVDQAILAHDGQARASRNRYVNLSAQDRANLQAFLGSL
jgi:CxxC motif-containing protein (DUF1111 family)